MTAPLFTIATISYDSGKWVGQTIESVLASTFTDFEYLVSDDCSPDDTWDVIRQYRDPRLRAWRNETNLGEYPNRNKILGEARGRFILYIDGDDILFKDALSQYAEFLKAFPEAKGVWSAFAIDFAVLPYLFSPGELAGLVYLGDVPVAEVGFTESVFEVDAIRKLGGFSERFVVGDRYFKRKFLCHHSVVLVPPGRSFWRQHPRQASRRAKSDHNDLVEFRQIDDEILNDPAFPLTGAELLAAKRKNRILWVKKLARHTLRFGNLLGFLKLRRRLRIPFSDLPLYFEKTQFDYLAGGSPTEPLVNGYHLPRFGQVKPL